MFSAKAPLWPKNALEPLISEETINFHYGKHHVGYAFKLTELVMKFPEFQGKSLEELISQEGTPVFNTAAQLWNHDFYWQCLRAPRENNEPTGRLRAAIEATFGSFQAFQVQFAVAALAQFGSGWAWLTQDSAGKLLIEKTSNAGTPLAFGHEPLLTCDVWEHAYYLDYRNERGKYIGAFWQLINWDFVAERWNG